MTKDSQNLLNNSQKIHQDLDQETANLELKLIASEL